MFSRSLLHPPLRDTESPSVDYVHQGMSRPVASSGGGRRRAGLSPRPARDRRSGGGAQVGAPLQFMDGLEDLVGVAEDGSLRDLLGVVSDERARGQRGASVASTVVPRRAAHPPLEDVQAMEGYLSSLLTSVVMDPEAEKDNMKQRFIELITTHISPTRKDLARVSLFELDDLPFSSPELGKEAFKMLGKICGDIIIIRTR